VADRFSEARSSRTVRAFVSPHPGEIGPDGRETEGDGGRGELPFFKVHSKAGDDGFTKRKAQLGAVPSDEFVNAATVLALRTR